MQKGWVSLNMLCVSGRWARRKRGGKKRKEKEGDKAGLKGKSKRDIGIFVCASDERGGEKKGGKKEGNKKEGKRGKERETRWIMKGKKE